MVPELSPSGWRDQSDMKVVSSVNCGVAQLHRCRIKSKNHTCIYQTHHDFRLNKPCTVTVTSLDLGDLNHGKGDGTFLHRLSQIIGSKIPHETFNESSTVIIFTFE